MKFRKLAVLILLSAVLPAGSVLHAQEDEEDVGTEEDYAGEGFSLQGGSGFFNVLSPVLIRPGNILAGFSYRTEFGADGASSPPVSLGYGLAKLSEVYVSFEPRHTSPGNEENEMLFGVKMLGH